MTAKWLKLETLLILHSECLAEHGGPEGVRDLGLLESALERPVNRANYGDGDLFDFAAEYAFGIVRNHPFVDGNKRTGFLSAATFLLINGQMLVASEAEATLKVLALASGEIDQTDFAEWLREHVEPLA
ncbi:MAG: type II toxin-antitoxin system death-on-curing family toxin [Henriciella sp.]